MPYLLLFCSHLLVFLMLKYTDPDDKYWVRLIGKNLTDEVFTTGSLSVATLWIMSRYNLPRYYGILLGARFLKLRYLT